MVLLLELTQRVLNKMKKKYKFRFFFDFGAGGCLWPNNETAQKDFDNPADAFIYDLNENVIYDPSDHLSLSKETFSMIEELDNKYYSYLNQDYPIDTEFKNKEEFLVSAKELYYKIVKELGDEFEVKWDFDIG